MRRVIIKEQRIANGYRVTLGYDVHHGHRRWWANDVNPRERVRNQRVTWVANRREAKALFSDLKQCALDVWFDEHVSMFRPRHQEGPYGGAFRDEQDYWHFIDPGLAREAYRL